VTVSVARLREIVGRIAAAEDTVSRGLAEKARALDELRILVGATEQPGDGGTPSVASTTPPAQEHPEQGVVASKPGRSASAPESQPGSGRDDLSDGAPAVTGHRAPAESPTAKTYPCPRSDCDFVGPTPQAVGAHRRYQHPAWVPKPVGTGSPPGPPSEHAKHKYVCARCPAEFLSRAGRDEHQATHPPVPDVEPMRRASRGAVDQLVNR
jgi:hypothetical protein